MTDLEAPVTALQAVVEVLAACLCEQLQDGPDLCFCGVLPGSEVAADVMACPDGGMAYVRVVSIYPSTVVGIANITPANCQWGQGFDVELGVFRAFPLDENGAMPDDDITLEATRWQMWDAQAMQKALACCTWLPKMDFVVGQYAPTGPEGGVLGGIIPVSAMLL